MNFYKNKVIIGGQEKVVVAFLHKDEDTQVVETTTVNRIHHIHILDRSGSMSSDIDELIDNVQKTIDVIGDEDLLTIIWFSSNGQHRTVIKGASKFDKLNSVLDSLRSVVGCTCFSDPLKEVNLVLDELGDVAPVSITLFTDGQAVVPWSTAEEEKRCFAELEKMKGRILAFNTVGYGYYYNQEFMKAMSATSEFGTFVHSSKIDDYMTIFSHNFEKISDAVCETIDLATIGAEIVYLTRSFTKMGQDFLHLSRIDKRKNQFFVVVDKANEDFSFVYQDKVYHFSDVQQAMSEATLNNYLYAYAYNLYYAGRRKEALDVIAELKDKALIDSHMCAFTFDECSAHIEKLRKAIFKSNCRYVDGVAPKNYVPADDARCVMDVLTFLQTGDSFYIPFSKNIDGYKRIGRKASEEINYFTKSEKEVRVPFNDFVHNKEHMNLSIRICMDGHVTLNPKRAKATGLPATIDSCIYRNHTIIKDGNLNIKKIEVLLTEKDYALCSANGIIDLLVDAFEVIDGVDYYRCVLNLEGLPIINRKYINESFGIDHIFDSAVKIAGLEAKNKLIGYYLDKVSEKSVLAKTGKLADYTVEQITVLEEHGLSKELVYQGFRKVASTEDSDSYESRTMTFTLAGCSSWPKVSEFFEKVVSGKKLTTSVLIMKRQLDAIEILATSKKVDLNTVNAKLRDFMLELQKETKTEMIKERSILGTLKIAKLLTGDFFEGLLLDEKNNYYYERDGIKMNVKIAYTTEFF